MAAHTSRGKQSSDAQPRVRTFYANLIILAERELAAFARAVSELLARNKQACPLRSGSMSWSF